jgi:hypothetical protein
VAKQFGLPGMREVKAKVKSRKKTRQAKRLRGKNKKDSFNDKFERASDYSKEDDSQEASKKDSLRYSFRSSDEDEYIIIKFTMHDPYKKDSILIKYPKKSDVIEDYDKQILKNYVDSNGVGRILLIEIKERRATKEETSYFDEHSSPVKKNLFNYFIQLNIPPQRILIIAPK